MTMQSIESKRHADRRAKTAKATARKAQREQFKGHAPKSDRRFNRRAVRIAGNVWDEAVVYDLRDDFVPTWMRDEDEGFTPTAREARAAADFYAPLV